MADVTITHTRAEGTILTGSVKGDGIFEIVRDHGFWFSRHVEGLFIRRSRDKAADTWRINAAAEALREAGHTVTVEINERERRSFAEAEADREERAEDRAERYSDRAGRARSSADARRAKADDISKRFEFGQPILVGHHSEGRARRDQARIDTNMRKSFEERDRAAYLANRAQAAANYERFRKDPYRTLRRLKKLRADLRVQERYAEEERTAGRTSERHEVNVIDLREEIALWEAVVEKAEADGVKIWRPDDFAPGDYVLYSGSWYQVKRVNPTTLSIAWNLRLAPKQVMTLKDATWEDGRTSTHTSDYTNVRSRCPEQAMDAFLADGKVPGTTAAAQASLERPASVVREEAKARPKAKKATGRTSDPKVPRRVFVRCDLGGAEAELTWLNGGSRPHKDFEPVKIVPPEGERFQRAVWSKALRDEIARLLAGHGLVLGKVDWQISRDRSGFVRDVEPAPPAEEQTLAEEVAREEEQTPDPGPEDASDLRIHGSSFNESAGETRVIQVNTGKDGGESNTTHPEESAMTATEQRLTRKQRHAAEMAERREQAAQRPEVERTAVLDTAYRRYVDDGIASTDGYYAPLDFQSWAATLGAPLVAAEGEAAGGAGAEGEAPRGEGEPAPDQAILGEPFAKSTGISSVSKVNIGNGGSSAPRTTPKESGMTATATPKKTAPKKATAKKTAAAPKKTAAETSASNTRTAPKDSRRWIPVGRIDADPNQPRKVFDQGKLEELARSMKRVGQLQPIRVQYDAATKRYTLIMGERRWRAAKIAEIAQMDAIVVNDFEAGDREIFARQVAENCGRADMTPMEEARAFCDLSKVGYEVAEISDIVGKSEPYVQWRIDLLRLIPEGQDALNKQLLPVGLSWYIAKCSTDNQARIITRYLRGGFPSTRAAEAFAQATYAEEKRVSDQGSFFVLADEEPSSDSGEQEALPGSLDLTSDERDRVTEDRAKLTAKIDKLGGAGEILSLLASTDPGELALLLAGTPGGIGGHELRIKHLSDIATKAMKNLREAQAVAAVRAGSIRVNPEAESAA